MKDLADFCPDVKTGTFYPGDSVEISPDGVDLQRQESDFVSILENNGHLVEFKPVAEVPPIRTLTKDKDRHEAERLAVTQFVEEQFLDALPPAQVDNAWRKWKVAYQLEVFGQNGSDIWSVDFASDDLKIVKGRIGKINLYEGIS